MYNTIQNNLIIYTSKNFLYIYVFFLACLVFWWLPSIVIYFNYQELYLEPETLFISLFAFITYTIGYIIFSNKYIKLINYKEELLLNINYLSKQITILLTIPSLIFAILFYVSRLNVNYGDGDGVPFLYQAFFYAQLSFFFIYISTTEDKDTKTKIFLLIVFLSIVIRLIVSLKWGRFFLIQGVFPILIIYLVRGWLKFNLKTLLISLLVAFFVFFIPSYFRGDFDKKVVYEQEIDFDAIFDNQNLTLEYLKASSTLKLFENNKDDSYEEWCNPLLVSLTQKIIPYSYLNICVMDIWREKDLATTLDRILAYKELGPELSQEVLNGPGSNYLLESYVSLYGIFGVFIVSLLLGIICAISFNSLKNPTLFGSLWLEILTRTTLAPRGNIGYVFERLPMLFLTIILLIVLSNLIIKDIKYE